MFRKTYFTYLLLVALFLISGISVLAQDGVVKGKVVMEKDGEKKPVKDVLVEMIRIDVVGKLPEIRTDAEGVFTFSNIPKDGTFALAVSGAGLKPEG